MSSDGESCRTHRFAAAHDTIERPGWQYVCAGQRCWGIEGDKVDLTAGTLSIAQKDQVPTSPLGGLAGDTSAKVEIRPLFLGYGLFVGKK
jgi:hypothetical protein